VDVSVLDMADRRKWIPRKKKTPAPTIVPAPPIVGAELSTPFGPISAATKQIAESANAGNAKAALLDVLFCSNFTVPPCSFNLY